MNLGRGGRPKCPQKKGTSRKKDETNERPGEKKTDFPGPWALTEKRNW